MDTLTTAQAAASATTLRRIATQIARHVGKGPHASPFDLTPPNNDRAARIARGDPGRAPWG